MFKYNYVSVNKKLNTLVTGRSAHILWDQYLHIHTPICPEDSSKTVINNRNYISRIHSVKNKINRLYKQQTDQEVTVQNKIGKI
jgi:hypothetical protein